MTEAPNTNNGSMTVGLLVQLPPYESRPRFGAPNAITPATIRTPPPAVPIPTEQRPAR